MLAIDLAQVAQKIRVYSCTHTHGDAGFLPKNTPVGIYFGENVLFSGKWV